MIHTVFINVVIVTSYSVHRYNLSCPGRYVHVGRLWQLHTSPSTWTIRNQWVNCQVLANTGVSRNHLWLPSSLATSQLLWCTQWNGEWMPACSVTHIAQEVVMLLVSGCFYSLWTMKKMRLKCFSDDPALGQGCLYGSNLCTYVRL